MDFSNFLCSTTDASVADGTCLVPATPAQKLVDRLGACARAVEPVQDGVLSFRALAIGGVAQHLLHRPLQLLGTKPQLAEVYTRAECNNPVEVELLVVHGRDAKENGTPISRLRSSIRALP